MDKNIIKTIVLAVTLVIIVSAILYVAIKGINLGAFEIVSVSGITDKKSGIEEKENNLDIATGQYNINLDSLERAKENYNVEKNKYELITEEEIAIIKEATKEEEYFIEYLWITLGNYATAHKLDLAIIEPGGKVNQPTKETSNTTNDTTVSTGTGITGNSSGVSSTTNAAATGSPTSGTEKPNKGETTPTASSDIVPSVKDLTVQVRGSYIDLADFVFEVENDNSLRFKLDNIKMKSAGGDQVLTSFNVKDFTVLKSVK